ncbi:MAG: hypothetical protein WAW37_09660 [Syntrophobacteraceae bacterium]
MLVRHKKIFSLGALFAATFLVVLLVIFSPIFGNGKNGLEFSDDLFNKLSKGSSYFIPDVEKGVKPFGGQSFTASVKVGNQDLAIKMLMAAGAQVGNEEGKLKVSGDLGKLLTTVLADSDAMYHNRGAEIAARYTTSGGVDADASAKKALKTWWEILNGMAKDFQFQKKIEQANVTDRVLKKGVEPAYNFYGVQAESVASKALLMTSLLVFYVLYTMWWGYGIFFMFDGIGLSMKKAKVKKEV